MKSLTNSTVLRRVFLIGIFFLSISVFCSEPEHPETIYESALKLDAAIHSHDGFTFYRVLAPYCRVIIDSLWVETADSIDSILQSNPFLVAYQDTFAGFRESLQKKPSTVLGVSTLGPSFSVGTDIVSAPVISNLIVKAAIAQAEQEAALLFLNQLKRELNKQSILCALFPKTTQLCNSVDPLSLSLLGTIRACFVDDIHNLPDDIWKLREISEMKAVLSKTPTLNYLLITPLVAKQLLKKEPVEKVLQHLANEQYFQNDTSTFGNMLRLLILFDQTMQKTSGVSTTLLNQIEAKALFGDKQRCNLVLGLMLQTPAAGRIAFRFSSSGSPESLHDIASTLVTFGTSRVRTAIQDAYEVMSLEEGNVSSSMEKMKVILQRSKKVYFDLSDSTFNSDEYRTFTKYFDIGIRVCQGILDTNYHVVIANVIILLRDMMSDGELNDKSSGFLKYAPFIAAIATATTEAELTEAIRNATFTMGSYATKRETFNVSLNTFLGVYGGSESSSFSWGPTMPIGIAVSFPLGKAWSLSVFPFLLDLGAVESFRVTQDSSSTPDFTWGNVFSPGIAIILNSRWPLSLGVGVQRTPQLRRVTAERSYLEPPTPRYMVFLSWDVPLLNLVTSP